MYRELPDEFTLSDISETCRSIGLLGTIGGFSAWAGICAHELAVLLVQEGFVEYASTAYRLYPRRDKPNLRKTFATINGSARFVRRFPASEFNSIASLGIKHVFVDARMTVGSFCEGSALL